MQQMQVKVKNSKGLTFSIPVAPGENVKSLKQKAGEKFGTSDVQNIKLIFRGKLLVDENTLESYEIKEDSLIMFLLQNKTPQQLQDEKDFEAHKNVDPNNVDSLANGRKWLQPSRMSRSP